MTIDEIKKLFNEMDSEDDIDPTLYRDAQNAISILLSEVERLEAFIQIREATGDAPGTEPGTCRWRVQKSSFEQCEPSMARTQCGSVVNYYPIKNFCPSCGGKIVVEK